jgi:hypothetical protein
MAITVSRKKFEIVPIPRVNRTGNELKLPARALEGLRQRRRKWLEVFANSGSENFRRWRELWLDAPDEDSLKALQAEVRWVWGELACARGKSDPMFGVKEVLTRWGNWHQAGVPVFTLSGCSEGLKELEMTPLINPGVLRYQLMLAFGEHHRRLYQCANPQCPRPYRIRERGKVQLYCDLAPCRRLADLSKNLRWWAAHGNEWRAKNRKENRG